KNTTRVESQLYRNRNVQPLTWEKRCHLPERLSFPFKPAHRLSKLPVSSLL
ncbi:hypothetical protein Csa_023542, partial [Cucumis sativus]